MAKNFMQKGDVVSLIAPADKMSGQGVLVGSIFGVAVNGALEGQPVECALAGVFELPKVEAQAWTQGARVYWSDADGLVTTVASGNKLIGVAASTAANPSPTGAVLLTGAFTQ